MAHFAQLDADNIVLQVIVVGNDDCQDDDGNESEAVGIAFCQSLLGADTIWKQTSYNHNIRVRYASIGDTYNADLDAFIRPQPYPAWTLSAVTKDWEPPVAKPDNTETHYYVWNETDQQWDQIAVGGE